MKLLLLNFLFAILINQALYAQNIGVNSTGATAHPSAILDVDAAPTFNKGFAMPRLTTAQRIAIVAPVAGLQVYDTNLKGFYYFDGTIWDCVSISAGSVHYFANITPPHGYLECNGQSVSTTQYPELFNAIGYTYGGAGANFNVPDLRGEFVRGLDNGRGIDVGRVIGALQIEDFKSHNHSATSLSGSTSTDGDHNHTYTNLLQTNDTDRGTGNASLWSIDNTSTYSTSTNGNHSHTLNITGNVSSSGGTETRPQNVALLPCIKF